MCTYICQRLIVFTDFSRRITHEHRIVYHVIDSVVEVLFWGADQNRRPVEVLQGKFDGWGEKWLTCRGFSGKARLVGRKKADL
ncbi:MAG: type II toxin-antitoxin system YoeB family toxin [Bacteroidales bacterium]|nr:type II toxin-antitoxin system YoeB family toxin [Bacteroidales bacterium]